MWEVAVARVTSDLMKEIAVLETLPCVSKMNGVKEAPILTHLSLYFSLFFLSITLIAWPGIVDALVE